MLFTVARSQADDLQQCLEKQPAAVGYLLTAVDPNLGKLPTMNLESVDVREVELD